MGRAAAHVLVPGVLHIVIALATLVMRMVFVVSALVMLVMAVRM
jgi:hypothetical protein